MGPTTGAMAAAGLRLLARPSVGNVWVMGFLDRAKKLADQAREKAEDALAEAKDRAGDALAEARARSAASPGPSSGAADRDPRGGTPYLPGMLGRPGWREQGLTDPAAVLAIEDRERAGVPRSTRSGIVEEPFGMGRRWSSGGRSVGLFYRLYPEQQGWEPPGGRTLFGLPGVTEATWADGRSLVFLGAGDRQVVFESNGLDESARASLVQAVAEHLG